MSDAELSGRADNLARAVVDLGESINELMERTQQSADKIRRSRRAIRLTIVALVVDVVLTGIVVYVFNRERQLSDAHDLLNRDVLCPLYALFIGTYDPKQRAGMAPDQQLKYDESYAVIRQGSRALGCRT